MNAKDSCSSCRMARSACLSRAAGVLRTDELNNPTATIFPHAEFSRNSARTLSARRHVDSTSITLLMSRRTCRLIAQTHSRSKDCPCPANDEKKPWSTPPAPWGESPHSSSPAGVLVLHTFGSVSQRCSDCFLKEELGRSELQPKRKFSKHGVL